MKSLFQSLILAFLFSTAASAQQQRADVTQAGLRLITVEPGVKLEVRLFLPNAPKR